VVSVATGRRVRRDVAMTGEVTLRGRVLPIGGVKDKLLAAHRAGIRTFLLPAKNLRDLKEVDKEILDSMEIHGVETVDEVLEYALLPTGSDSSRASQRRVGFTIPPSPPTAPIIQA
jgi:ATP-dependent Lon protease